MNDRWEKTITTSMVDPAVFFIALKVLNDPNLIPQLPSLEHLGCPRVRVMYAWVDPSASR